LVWLEAIADEVRLGILRHLSRWGDATVADLARAAGAHPNTVRSHLSALENAEVVQAFSVRSPVHRGRPRMRFRLVEDWTLPTTDFLGLSELLAAVITRLHASPGTVRAVGGDWGRYLLGRPGRRDVRRELSRALERLGFYARTGDSSLELTACPCPLVLPDRPELVCGMAVGVCEGVLAASGSGLRVGRRMHRPSQRSCTVALEPIHGGQVAAGGAGR
jgi:predicted ArsR family transcriptional regulator